MKRERELIRNFIQLHSLKTGECKNSVHAYEETERVWIERTGERFYKNYPSFAAARTYYMKSRGRMHVIGTKFKISPKEI